jgi:hypothetical protein
MINSTSSSGGTVGTDAAFLSSAKPSVNSLPKGQDRLSLSQADGLRQALAAQPEVRPEMVEKGRALAADPSYPSAAIIQRIAQGIMAAPDLSEDQS